MTGLSAELMYPNQTMKFLTRRSVVALHDSQNGKMTYMRKKGSQHSTNAPMTMAIVRAARRSFDSEIFWRFSRIWERRLFPVTESGDEDCVVKRKDLEGRVGRRWVSAFVQFSDWARVGRFMIDTITSGLEQRRGIDDEILRLFFVRLFRVFFVADPLDRCCSVTGKSRASSPLSLSVSPFV